MVTKPHGDQQAEAKRQQEVLSRARANTELQRQIAASNAEHAAGGKGVPWQQVRAEKMARAGQ